ncbi:MAG: SPFH domain-containing protein [Planctomycetaceae bacterium]
MREIDEARSMHFLFLATPATIVAFFAAFRLWTSSPAVPFPSSSALAIVLLVSACVWHALGKLFRRVSADRLPEASAVAEVFRESTWGALIGGGGLLLAAPIPEVQGWVNAAILGWVIAVAAEQAGRAVLGWCLSTGEVRFRSPVNLLLREAALLRANPMSSLFDVAERRFGLSLRSTWAITFVRLAFRPAAILLALFVWGISGVVVIEPHQWGVREEFGRLVGDPLPPGLHASLPWPVGRIRVVPVKTVATMQLGFRDSSFSGSMSDKKAILWTKAHDEEFGLVLGGGTELVAVNAVVYFKVAEDRDAFLNYVYHTQTPESALEAYAYRVLMEETCTETLEGILAVDREEFVHRLRRSLQAYAAEERLGLEVIDVALINLHPPVEAASAYLDTISAAIDADRSSVEALGQVAVEQRGAEQERRRLVNEARVDANRRLASASSETSRFRAAREVYETEGPAFKVRMVFDALGEMFAGKRLVVVDRELADRAGGVLLDLRNLDRPTSDAPLSSDATDIGTGPQP